MLVLGISLMSHVPCPFGSSGRFIPGASEPVGNQPDSLFVEDLMGAKSRHAIVSFAVEIRVGGIADKIHQPLAGGVAGEIGCGGLFVGFTKLMAIGALHVALNERAA